MPFISSVSGSKGGLIWPLGTPVIAPTITINSTTNYNQNIATFNATVNPNGATTSVKFQYSTNSGSTWTDGATISSLTGGSQSVYSNQTGLSVNTGYTVRAIATNSAGSTTSSTTTFTTWSLKTFSQGGGSANITIPTVTPTGSSTVVPTLYNILVVGGGGGSYFGGGAGGDYNWVTSRSFNNTSNLVITATMGGGGAPGATGGTSSLSNSSFTAVSAVGGGSSTNAQDGGSLPSRGSYGGAGFYYTDGAKTPTFSSAGGGGAGNWAGGYNAYSSNNSYNGYAVGGTGGYSYYNSTWNVYVGGGGGGGYNSSGGGENGIIDVNNSYWGRGGSCSGVTDNYGIAGAIWFQYYGP